MASVSPITTADQFGAHLRTLNRWLAQYKLLLRQLGTGGDSARLREQLRSLLTCLLTGLQSASDSILPTVQSHQCRGPADPTWRDWEAKYTTFVQTAESTVENAERAAALLARARPSLQVFTGVSEAIGCERRSIFSLGGGGSGSVRSSSRRGSTARGSLATEVESATVAVAASASSAVSASATSAAAADNDEDVVAALEEAAAVFQDAATGRKLVEQLQSAVIVTHWTVEHSLELDSLADMDADVDAVDVESNDDAVSADGGRKVARTSTLTMAEPQAQRSGSRIAGACVWCK